MRRALLLLTTMALGVLMVGSVAQAASPRAQCQQEAASLGSLDGYKFVYGNNKKDDDFTSRATAGQLEVFCGLGGNDYIQNLDEGDIFIGGTGNDFINANFPGSTFIGGAGNDTVQFNYGTFIGGDGSDSSTNGDPPVDGTGG